MFVKECLLQIQVLCNASWIFYSSYNIPNSCELLLTLDHAAFASFIFLCAAMPFHFAVCVCAVRSLTCTVVRLTALTFMLNVRLRKSPCFFFFFFFFTGWLVLTCNSVSKHGRGACNHWFCFMATPTHAKSTPSGYLKHLNDVYPPTGKEHSLLPCRECLMLWPSF